MAFRAARGRGVSVADRGHGFGAVDARGGEDGAGFDGVAGAGLERGGAVPEHAAGAPSGAGGGVAAEGLRVQGGQGRDGEGGVRDFPDAREGHHVPRRGEGRPHQEGGEFEGFRDRAERRESGVPLGERGGRHHDGGDARDPRRRPRGEHVQAHRALRGARGAGAEVRALADDRQRAGEAVFEAGRGGVCGRVQGEGVFARGVVQFAGAAGVESGGRPRGDEPRGDGGGRRRASSTCRSCCG